MSDMVVFVEGEGRCQEVKSEKMMSIPHSLPIVRSLSVSRKNKSGRGRRCWAETLVYKEVTNKVEARETSDLRGGTNEKLHSSNMSRSLSYCY